ncbi:hypothetical protein NLM24_12995 [Nocardia zapadnayensis]|uniref:hypothetical protein n=1 Tax=Nocardia rhamnosiphila TaxID=426716 RepID=UPI0022483466|nr:hypothetical protein [Nocardia zapadnayensis]MCX0271608.1 hypothetical protein [Nocardia zapadnayensis]
MHDQHFIPSCPPALSVRLSIPAGLFFRLPGQAFLFQAGLLPRLLVQASLSLLLEACLLPRLSFHAGLLLRLRPAVCPFPRRVQTVLFFRDVSLQPLDLPRHSLLFPRQLFRHPMGVVPRPGQIRQHPCFLVAVPAFQDIPARLGRHIAPVAGADRSGVIPLPLLLSAQLIPLRPEFVPSCLQLLQAASPVVHPVLRDSQFRDVALTVVRRPGRPALGLPMCIEPVHRVRERRVVLLGPLEPPHEPA